MAKPLPSTELLRGGANGSALRSPASSAVRPLEPSSTEPRDHNGAPSDDEMDLLRAENDQLRALCTELEQALQEAAHSNRETSSDDRFREYEALLEEKSETIRKLHQQVQDAQATIGELEAERNNKPIPSGPAPREDDLLKLSEDLESERRQLQEDEQALMEQMREMELGMARERAEMARQRNDLQRLQSEIRHELDRLERNGALQNKIDSLKSKLHDAVTRRGLAPQAGAAAAQPPPAAEPPPQQQQKKDGGSLLGRLFGK